MTPPRTPPWLGSCVQFFLQHTWQTFIVYIVCLSLLLVGLVSTLTPDNLLSLKEDNDDSSVVQPTRSLVLAKTRREDVSWAYNLTSNWDLYVHTADEEPGFRPIPANKGREGMTYLTHIINNYDNLTDVTVFMHGAATQWHNDIGDTNSSFVLSHLQIDAVKRRGYTNLRCQQRPGCPVAVRPSDPQFTSQDNIVYRNFTAIYMDLFEVPPERVPAEVGGICCGQFALTKERIHERPLEEYIYMRNWALSSAMDNFTIGSVFEMLWHVIFLEGPVSCPDTEHCYCELYGFCDT